MSNIHQVLYHIIVYFVQGEVGYNRVIIIKHKINCSISTLSIIILEPSEHLVGDNRVFLIFESGIIYIVLQYV